MRRPLTRRTPVIGIVALVNLELHTEEVKNQT